MSLYNIGVASSFLSLFIIILFVIIGWWIYIRISPFHVKVNKIPGPKFHLPIVGNSIELIGGFDHVLQMFHEKWPNKYGPIYRIFIGSECYIPISSPELLETIFNSQTLIDKGMSYSQLLPWLGEGLLISTGDLWRSRRKLLTPAFHFKILNSFVDVFNEQSRILCGIIEEICQSFTEGKGEMDVHPLITKCSLDIICEAAMGTKVNAQTEDSEYVRAVYDISKVLLKRFQRPWLQAPHIFALTALGREHDQLLKILHSFTDDIINKRREYLNEQKDSDGIEEKSENGIRKPLPLLDLLLKASDDGKNLSQLDIREEIDTFMFEGHDTTTSMMGWFLYSMASNPECQEKVSEELENVFGSSDRDCTQEDMPNLKYLECCIKETLRMYPSVPLFERTITEDVQIGKYLIPSGCTVGCLVFAAHRNPEIFPDPLVFKPERFFPEASIGRHPYAYFPFSAGSRNCIGQRFAILESKIVLSTLLRRFKFELSLLAKSPVIATQLILKSLTGINLVVSRR